ncbi:MAG TPA: GntR family transcriptional regulator [Aggregatilineales bacterium]|nr:GntR family transcriptional regulator [Aggregatilineales bacterium]
MTLTINFSDTSSLVQIHNKSLREHVLEMLHGAIVNGELKPGQALVEAELASQLGVSRAPVREAINILATQGLVEVVPYRGTTVKKLSRKDVEELYSVRSLMEGYAIQQIILSERTAQVVSDLREVCKGMQQAADEGDLRAVNEIDRDFHDTLVAACGNDLLLSMWSTVSMRVRQVMSLRNRRKGDLQAIARNHVEIVEIIASKNLEKALALIHHHIGMTGGAIVKDWPEEEMTMDIEAAP